MFGLPTVPPVPPNATDAQLAIALESMLTNPQGQIYPNPVDQALGAKKDLKFLVGDELLFILDPAIGSLGAIAGSVANSMDIKKITWYPTGGYDEDGPAFDFRDFSATLKASFPNVTGLCIRHMNLSNFTIESSVITHLEIIAPSHSDRVWHLSLPSLRVLLFEPDPSAFAAGVLRSPRIERFFAHKFWRQELRSQKLYFPSCTDFTMRRLDCVTGLRVYLPRVKTLNLDACYEMDDFRFLNKGHASHKDFNVDERAQSTNIELSCVNAILSAKTMKYLNNSGRLAKSVSEADAGMDDYY